MAAAVWRVMVSLASVRRRLVVLRPSRAAMVWWVQPASMRTATRRRVRALDTVTRVALAWSGVMARICCAVSGRIRRGGGRAWLGRP